MAKNSVKAIQLKSIDVSTISAITWVAFDELEEACSLIRITNNSDTGVLVSFNGTDDHEVVMDGSTVELNLQANSSPNNNVSKIKKGTVLYLSGTAGTGYVYLSGYYNELD